MAISTQRLFCALSPVLSTFSALQGKSERSSSLSVAALHWEISELKLLEDDADTCREGRCEAGVRWCLLPMRRRMNLVKCSLRAAPWAGRS